MQCFLEYFDNNTLLCWAVDLTVNITRLDGFDVVLTFTCYKQPKGNNKVHYLYWFLGLVSYSHNHLSPSQFYKLQKTTIQSHLQSPVQTRPFVKTTLWIMILTTTIIIIIILHFGNNCNDKTLWEINSLISILITNILNLKFILCKARNKQGVIKCIRKDTFYAQNVAYSQ